jgi:RNA polymerase sigma factor (sigma-70 family)
VIASSSSTACATREPPFFEFRLLPSSSVSEDWELDLTLLERWRNNDLRGGRALFERHSDAVIRFFRNKFDSEYPDLVQETFVRLVESRDRIQDGQAFRAYVLGIARRVLLEHLRELPRQRAFDPAVDSVAALLPGPSTIAARRRELRLLLEGLRRIPLEHQIVLELFYWEKMKATELAVTMGVSPSTMRGRLHRARASLRRALAELAEAPELIESTTARLDDWAEQVRLEHLRREP